MSLLLRALTWWNSQTINTQVWTKLYGERIGEDEEQDAPLIIADLQRTNRVLLEETIEQLRLIRFGPPRIPPVHDDDRG